MWYLACHKQCAYGERAQGGRFRGERAHNGRTCGGNFHDGSSHFGAHIASLLMVALMMGTFMLSCTWRAHSRRAFS